LVKKTKNLSVAAQRKALAEAVLDAKRRAERISADNKKEWSIMRSALVISAIVHLVLLSIHFQPELKNLKDRLPALEVMLVNSKTDSKPKNADVFAQTNLDRGGNTEQDRMMQSALPSVAQAPTNNALTVDLQNSAAKPKRSMSAAEKEQQRLAELEKQAKELLIQLKSSAKVEKNSIPNAQNQPLDQNGGASQNQDAMDEINQTLQEMNRLEALIAKQQEEYQKRPKRKFIGARAREYRYALYVDNWRQKVEKVGNTHYPLAAKQKKIYGQLQLTVSIRKDGTIEKIELDQSSGHKILDEAAKHIVELGAPYAKFSEEIAKETDILSITRTWTFTREDQLKTQD
jgi:protein TonB